MKHAPLVTLSLAIGIFFALAQVNSGTKKAEDGNKVSEGPPPKTIKTKIGELNYEVGYPTEETSQKLYDEMDLQRACQAYMWSFPAVSFASIKAGFFRDLGATYNDILLYPDFLDTKSLYLTGNNTTIYAASQLDLTDGPVVGEVPAGPTAGMLADLWFKTYGVGRLGPDKGEGGKYLCVPPGYKGELPKEGYAHSASVRSGMPPVVEPVM